MSDIKPYTIAIDEAEIGDLKKRLSLARFPDELDDAGWDLGAPLADIKRIANYWQTSFDWRNAEADLNRFAHFTTNIQVEGFEELNIHFIHQKSDADNAIPLLFIHGWPGSFIEATKILKPLSEGRPGAPTFHVVVPSLPNFGFSQGPKKRGFNIQHYAEVFHKLMMKLGYDQYVTQGGDWGFAISRSLSMNYYPEHCRAQHLNMCAASPPDLFKNPLLAIKHALQPYSERDREALARTGWFQREGSGYRSTQSTKPQTLGYALADSPVALLAWIYEKLHDWTDDYPWTDDEICTWVSIYWFSTAGPAASIRIYYEVEREAQKPNGVHLQKLIQWQNIPIGLGHFPKDVVVLPNIWTRTLGNVVYDKEHPDGGHFAAFEKPDYIVADLQEMFGKGGGASGVIKDGGI